MVALRQVLGLLLCVGLTVSQQCGRPSVQPSSGNTYANYEEDRIVGGKGAVPHSWPWQVSLQNARGHFCGGSLINSQWVVTAAHCLVNVFSVNVKLGEHNLYSPDQGETIIPSSLVRLHPGYNRQTSVHDIAMIRLSRPVTFSRTIQPVCLPSQGAELSAGQYVYVTGWGHTGSVAVSPILKQVMVPTIDYNTCARMSPRYVSPYSVCTGFSTGGHNPCFGDSGGPLVYSAGGTWYLHGVVSWGPQRCAIKEEPAIFVKVSSYVPWIQQTMGLI